ncbi:MAG: hypothetical protein HQ494_12115, partial [Rhodospirillales bacterium]|nr:hypothetical protein [Rhodospirillales bacterium]
MALPATAPKPAPQSDAFLGGLSSGGLKLSAPVGPGAANIPDDVFRVESVLSGADMLPRPPGRTFGDDTLSAIRTAQGRLNTDTRLDLAKSPLKLDGLINPDGPTQSATRLLAGDVLAKRTPSAIPGTVPAPGGLKRETLEQTAKRFANGVPKNIPAKPDMSADDFASLERLAGGLRANTHPGPVAKDIADAFGSNATGTAAEFKVVRDALVKSGTPEQVKNLTEGVRAELAPDQRKR